MQLTRYTDYSLRVLIYLAVNPENSTVSEIASSYGVSRNHLVKVVHNLSTLGYIQTTRGRTGGMRLALSPEKINIGQIVRELEHSLDLVECFNSESNTCPIARACGLKHVLVKAHNAFLATLDDYSLKDVVGNKQALANILL